MSINYRSNIGDAIDTHAQYYDLLGKSTAILPEVNTDKVDDMYNSMGQLDRKTLKLQQDEANILTQQSATKRILDREMNRLLSKQASVDTVMLGSNRLSLLNRSFNARYMAYTKVVLVLIVAMLFVLAYFSFPDFILFQGVLGMFFMVVVICWAIIVICLKLYDISRRDHIDFDKLDQRLMVTPEDGIEAQRLADANGDKFSFNHCFDENCCFGDNLQWDNSIGKCVMTVSGVDAVAESFVGGGGGAGAGAPGGTLRFTAF